MDLGVCEKTPHCLFLSDNMTSLSSSCDPLIPLAAESSKKKKVMQNYFYYVLDSYSF